MKGPPPPNLVQLLADIFPFADESRSFVLDLSVPAELLVFEGAAKPRWDAMLREIRRHMPYETIVQHLRAEYPNLPWDFYERGLLDRRPNNLLFSLRDDIWKGDGASAELEHQLSNQSLLLPIHFLEQGLRASRSVAKVLVPGLGSGTGFLIENNLFVTSNHVLPNRKRAGQARIIFNFRNSADGMGCQPVEFRLDPATAFYFSDEKENDWTVVAVRENANKEWGALRFAPESATKHSLISVIQHPGGGPQHIALANNRVAYADIHSLHYLAETSGGSSGSPVFNRDWYVVGIHKQGGFIVEALSKSRRLFFRNAGVPAALIRQGLIDKGLMSR
jgi:hypothetical protein